MILDQEIVQELIFEGDDGYLHTMLVQSKNETDKTLTGFTTVFKPDPRGRGVWRERILATIPEHRIRP